MQQIALCACGCLKILKRGPGQLKLNQFQGWNDPLYFFQRKRISKKHGKVYKIKNSSFEFLIKIFSSVHVSCIMQMFGFG